MGMQPPSIGKNILIYRKRRGMTIDELSKRSGVSKSMLSQVEQEKSNPTVVTVWKIARSLDVSINQLLQTEGESSIEVIRKEDMPIIYSEDGKCMIRISSSVHMVENLELYHMIFQPGGINSSQAHFPGTQEFLTVLSGKIKVTIGERSKTLKEGDSTRYNGDLKHIIENVFNDESEVYLVVWFPK
ncbi:MAG TPA: XRE family transcriptional regulator [Clostridia bacterium]|nr:XRE family transcriptional regulator [Clostridia bacterium]